MAPFYDGFSATYEATMSIPREYQFKHEEIKKALM